jgi:hypothetical protein
MCGLDFNIPLMILIYLFFPVFTSPRPLNPMSVTLRRCILKIFVEQVGEPRSSSTPDGGTSSKLGYL